MSGAIEFPVSNGAVTVDTHAAKPRGRRMQDRGRMGTMRKAMAVLVLLSLGTPSPAAEVAFGKDLKPERAREILMEVRPGLLAVVKATPEGRTPPSTPSSRRPTGSAKDGSASGTPNSRLSSSG